MAGKKNVARPRAVVPKTTENNTVPLDHTYIISPSPPQLLKAAEEEEEVDKAQSRSATRAAPIEKKQPPTALDLALANAVAAVTPTSTGYDGLAASGATIKELGHHYVQTETQNAVQVVKKPLPTSNCVVPFSRRAGTPKKVPKPAKPKW
nr:protein SAD1/UNC-84 domain protein 1-like isoform X1 [Ipomoea batatas]